MKEYFILSDIHSFFTPMKKVLDENNFDVNNENHILVILGDLMDRGTESKQVLDFVYDLFKKSRTILIRGNHEDLFDDMVKSRVYHYYDESNGSIQTLADLNTKDLNNKYEVILNFNRAIYEYDKRWDELKNAMVDYYELGNYIFVHGWIPVLENERDKFLYDPKWREASKPEWELARWINGMSAAHQGVIENGKTIICGHWHCSYGNVRKKYPEISWEQRCGKEFDKLDKSLFKPYYSDGIIAIDACTGLTGICNCIHLKESELYETKNQSN